MDIETVRDYLANALKGSGPIPKTATAEFATELDPGDAAMIHYKWLLTRKGPHSDHYAREIVVHISTGVMDRFRSAAPIERGEIEGKIVRALGDQLRDSAQYDERESFQPAATVRINEDSLKSK